MTVQTATMQKIAAFLGHQCATLVTEEEAAGCKSPLHLCHLWQARMLESEEYQDGVVAWNTGGASFDASWTTASGRLTIDVWHSTTPIIRLVIRTTSSMSGYEKVLGQKVAQVSFTERYGSWGAHIDMVDESLIRGREDRVSFLLELDKTMFGGALQREFNNPLYPGELWRRLVLRQAFAAIEAAQAA